MCGTIQLGAQKVYIDCLAPDLDVWKRHLPPIDWTTVRLGDTEVRGPSPEPWRGDLTRVGDVLSIAGQLEDRELAGRLGLVAAEVGNRIVERLPIDVRFEWVGHNHDSARCDSIRMEVVQLKGNVRDLEGEVSDSTGDAKHGYARLLHEARNALGAAEGRLRACEGS